MEQIVRNIHENLTKKRQQMIHFKECLTKTNEYLFKTKEYLTKVDLMFTEVQRRDELINENLDKLFSAMNTSKGETNKDRLFVKSISVFDDVVYDKMHAEFEKQYTESQEEEKMKRKRSRDSSEYHKNNYKQKLEDVQRPHPREGFYKTDNRNRHMLNERHFDDKRNIKPFTQFKNNRPSSSTPEQDRVKNVKNNTYDQKCRRDKSDFRLKRLKSHDSEEDYKKSNLDFRMKNEIHENKSYKERSDFNDERLKSHDLKEPIKKPAKSLSREPDFRVGNAINEYCDKKTYECDKNLIENLGQDLKRRNFHEFKKEEKRETPELDIKQEKSNETVRKIIKRNKSLSLSENDNMESILKVEKNIEESKDESKNLNEKDVIFDDVTLIREDKLETEIKTDNNTSSIRNLEDVKNEVKLKSQPRNEIEEGEISELSNTSTSSGSSSDSDTQSDKNIYKAESISEIKTEIVDLATEVVIEEPNYKDEPVSLQIIEDFENVVEVEVVSQTIDSEDNLPQPTVSSEETLSINDKTKVEDKLSPSNANLEIDSNSDINTSVCSNTSLKQNSTLNPNVINITLTRRRRKIIKLE